MKGVSFKKKEKLSDRTGGVTIMQTATKKETALGIRQMAMIGVMTAVTCIAAPFSIPIPVSPVPLSLTTFILYLSVYILGTRNAFISYVIYLLLGLVGLPVFSGGSAGAAKLFGPTGGYLVGYLFLALIAGAFVGRYTENKWKSIAFAALGMVLGTMVLYALGTAWLAYSAGMDFQAALWAGVIPFIPGDLVKMVIAVLLGSAVRGRLLRAGILEGNN